MKNSFELHYLTTEGPMKHLPISENSFRVLENANEKIENACNYLNYCHMVKSGAMIFLTDSKELKPNSPFYFADLNRLLLSLLSNFYTWIEFCEREYKSLFTITKKKFYDSYFPYRLFYSLRKYMTHGPLGITEASFNLLEEDSAKFYINLDKLFEKKEHLQKDLRSDLIDIKRTTNRIDITPIVDEFIKMFDALSLEFFNAIYDSSVEKQIRISVEKIPNDIQSNMQCHVISRNKDNEVDIRFSINGSIVSLLSKYFIFFNKKLPVLGLNV